MSRAQRRATRGSARSRRTPVRAAPTRRLRIPWIPVAVVLGIAAVVGVVIYLVIQAGQPASPANAEAQAAEADASADLPGEWINIPGIYGGPYGADANHVSEPVDYSEQGLPPAGGHHWGRSECTSDPATAPPFCGPVPPGFYGRTTEAWDPESLVHNLEHAAVVVWYNTSDQAIIDDLRDFAEDNGAGESHWNVTTFFPDMEEETIAITSWSRRLTMSTDEYDRDALQDFFNAHECRFDPEGFCDVF